MDSRTRLQKTIAGEATDRPPVALWRHWPGDDQRAADLAVSVIEYQKTYGWDFVNVAPADTYQVVDYGLQDQWEPNASGTRTITRPIITKSLHWTELRPLDPTRGALARQSETLNLVSAALGEQTPIIQTIYSPLAQARRLAGESTLLMHMRAHPDRLRSGLNAITESTLRWVEALRRVPIVGIYYVVEHATHSALSEDEFRSFGLPYDRKILETLSDRWWCNLLHLDGTAPMVKITPEYRVHAVNWADRDSETSLNAGKQLVNGAVCGGLSPWQHLHYGSPTTVRDALRDAISQTTQRRLILTASGSVPITAPLSNLRAVRDWMHNAGSV